MALPEGVDPYRTAFGISEGMVVFLIVGSIMVLFAGFAILMSVLSG